MTASIPRRGVNTQTQERRRKTEVRAREKQIRRQKDNTRASDSKHVTQTSPDHHEQEKREERGMAQEGFGGFMW